MAYESRRAALQAGLDAVKSQAERNRLGQFATPTELAAGILDCSRELVPDGSRIRFLDPAFGTGSFYSALLRTFPRERIVAAEGFEIDPHYATPSADLWRDTPFELHIADFTRAAPPAETAARFTLVVCNPPYVRHQHISQSEKARLRRAARQACGVDIGGLAGLYCYFIGITHAWLAKGGIAAWLVPSEFMDVNYGEPIKHYLLNNVCLLRIHRFDPHDVQFADALVSSAVVWFHNCRPSPAHHVAFTFGGTLKEPSVSRTVPNEVLQNEPKWTRFPVSAERNANEGLRLGDLFVVKRGLVTGHNRFFIMTKDRIDASELPMRFFRPILPGPRFIQDDEIQADGDGRPLVRPQLFLLDCRLPEGEVRLRHPTLWRYLETGIGNVSNRYICRHRSPWYSQENRPPAPFMCNYMGRSGGQRRCPFRFILNHSQATAANVYLLLYPKPELSRALRAAPELSRRLWQALNSIQAGDMLEEGRVYGGGLHKLEPNELANVPADSLSRVVKGLALRRARQHTLF